MTIFVTDSVAAETGANPGTFTISRTGSTGSSLTVQYAITGNATNGVDYQTIATSVSIAAGSATRLVTINPIDDTVVDGAEQAILTRTANPAYVVGSPGSASLTIADNDASTGTTRSFQDGVSPTASYAGTTDACISEPDQNSKFGTVNTLRVDADAGAGKDISTLLKWDVSSIPPGIQVQAVRLSIYVTNRSAQPYQVFELEQLWVETQASWTSYSSGSKWSVAGAQGSLDRRSIVLGTVNASALGSYSLTLNSSGVALVQSWINTPSPNQRIIITNATSVDDLVFSARNASTKANRPKLTVTYQP